ncbi:MAG: branched-chain amino acid ABC transporter permease [Syntrophorhabdales bacterium]
MHWFASFTTFLQIFVNGIFLGCMYGVAAIGLSLIFGCMQIIFLAQGAVMILAAYCVFWMVTFTPLSPFWAFIFIIPVFLGFGFALYTGLFQRVAKTGKNPSLLLAFGLMVLLEHVMAFVFSADYRTVTTKYASTALGLAGVSFSVNRVIVALVACAATALVFLFLKKTILGKAVRAVSEDMGAAALLGMRPEWVSAVTFSIGISLAGVAGVATCIIFPFDPYFGFIFSLKALIAVAFGGLGSVGGVLLGGVILGVLESMTSYTISGGWADAVAYAAFLLVLIFRPEGLLGRRLGEKA